jgi:GrpB-like predicted nucleotidyltransferase (UPF0157 family)
LQKRHVEVVDYKYDWQHKFAIERDELKKIIINNTHIIEHIGSTSVIGLCAKPIIDILVEVSSLEKLDKLNHSFTAFDYIVKGENGIPGRRYFQKGGNKRSHHIHAFKTGDFNLIRHRAFKTYLIKYPTIAKEYGQIKHSAALNCNDNISHYMILKNDFILKHEPLAVNEYLKVHKLKHRESKC